MVNEEIEITVVAVEGDTIRLGIKAPKHISIHRKEIYLAIQHENQSASQLSLDMSELMKFKMNKN